MKKSIFVVLSLLVIAMFLVGCAPQEELSQEDQQALEAELEQMPDSELDQVIVAGEVDEGAAIAGQAYYRKYSAVPKRIVVNKALLEKNKRLLSPVKILPKYITKEFFPGNFWFGNDEYGHYNFDEQQPFYYTKKILKVGLKYQGDADYNYYFFETDPNTGNLIAQGSDIVYVGNYIQQTGGFGKLYLKKAEVNEGTSSNGKALNKIVLVVEVPLCVDSDDGGSGQEFVEGHLTINGKNNPLPQTKDRCIAEMGFGHEIFEGMPEEFVQEEQKKLIEVSCGENGVLDTEMFICEQGCENSACIQ